MLSIQGCYLRSMPLGQASWTLLYIQEGHPETDFKERLQKAIAVCEEIELGKKSDEKQVVNSLELEAAKAFKPDGKTSILSMAGIESVKPLLDLLKKVISNHQHLSMTELVEASEIIAKLQGAYIRFSFEKLDAVDDVERALEGR